jgi:hypothetical protein
MKKIIVLITICLSILMFTGCEEVSTGSQNLSKNMEKNAAQMASNQNKLEKIIPIPEMDYSNNRANISKRLDTYGKDQNKVSWIYCFTPSGQCVLFTSVKGCVTNLSAYAVPDDQIVDYRDQWGNHYAMTVQSPDADGTYGTNGEGIFWFDTAGVYHEWNGLYMMVDQPVKLNIEPMIIMNIDAE